MKKQLGALLTTLIIVGALTTAVLAQPAINTNGVRDQMQVRECINERLQNCAEECTCIYNNSYGYNYSYRNRNCQRGDQPYNGAVIQTCARLGLCNNEMYSNGLMGNKVCASIAFRYSGVEDEKQSSMP